MKPSERYLKIEQHLTEENPILLETINAYKELDKIGYKIGLLTKEQTYAEQISWWPLISVLGTFSAGKSSFINQYLGRSVQVSGNQAIDDKFTVICYGHADEVHTLPGLALDSDPRFPFFEISEEINNVEGGEGSRIDSYIQLKTVPEEILKGKILIDSPGFDADSQRDSTLKITDHIIDMSDLVLVFFDARHPEPGAMRDTLEHLVKTNIGRRDVDKILFILNQIDTAAQEDNPEEIVGAWQRALSQEGLIGGNFFTIYNEKLANTIENPAIADRFKRKKDIDLEAITSRMQKISIERSYRISNSVHEIADKIENEQIPELKKYIKSWRRKVIIADVIILGGIFAFFTWIIVAYGDMLTTTQAWLMSSIVNGIIVGGVALFLIVTIHFNIRSKLIKMDAKKLAKKDSSLANALLHNNRFWHGMFSRNPRGWGRRSIKKIASVRVESKQAIQKLTDQFADPSGKSGKAKDSKEDVTSLEG